MTDLKRTAYEKMLAWKQHAGHKTLEVSGARQVGKTYLVNKFADEQYAHKIYVNMLELSGEVFQEIYQDIRKEMKTGKWFRNPVKELLLRYQPDFVDSKDTVVIIDEIQESAGIYNRIREFTRGLESDFIVTGSYLGRILHKEFCYSAGDMASLEIQTLSFEEFLDAFGKLELFHRLDIFGFGKEADYQEISSMYEIYRQIGGYPAVVLKYLTSASVKECQQELQEIIRLFTNESRRYFDDILDYEAYGNLFCSVARVLVREKKGFEEDSFSEELKQIVAKDYSSNLGKAVLNRAIDWLYSSGIIGFAGKITNYNILDFRAKARCYFMDIGLTSFFLKQIGCRDSDIDGIANENFVYLDLKRRGGFSGELAFQMPAFATWGKGELDFYTKSLESGNVYVVEVKAGKNSAKTAEEVLERGKADYLLLAKGNTHGGKAGRVYTIPVYGISKFQF